MTMTLDLLLVALGIALFVGNHYYLRHQKPKTAKNDEKKPQYIDQWLLAKDFVSIGAFTYSQLLTLKPLTEYVYRSAAGDILVEMGDLDDSNVLVMYTLFTDNSYIETDFPRGRNIEQPNYSRHVVTTGLEAAYAYHRQKIRDWGRGVVPLRTVDDYHRFSELDKQQRRRHGSDRDFILVAGGLAFILTSGIFFYLGEGSPLFLTLAIVALLLGLALMHPVTRTIKIARPPGADFGVKDSSTGDKS